MMTTKTVAIIGAGPSGLVAAKTLLRSKTCKYNVQIFEKTNEVGGLWRVHKEKPYDGMLNPEMPTNLSRFNIGFSDLAWASVGLEGHVPFWPKAWQVGQYLRAYVDRYIPKDVFSFGTQVIYAGTDEQKDGKSRWRLKWKKTSMDGAAETSEGVFDYLVIATGFFGASSMGNLENAKDLGIKTVHSTKLRNLEDVLPETDDVTGTLLVIGGGMSGADATTVLANQLSDARYSPDNKRKRFAQVELVQLCPDAAYALPLAASVSPPTSDDGKPLAPRFYPLDLAMYDLGKRPPGDIELATGQQPPEVIQMIHDAFQGMVGDQHDLGVPGLKYDAKSRAAYVTLTELYSGFIRSGDIKIITGRLKRLTTSETGTGMVQAQYSHQDESRTIENVLGVVCATGFTPQPSLEFLSPELKQALEYDPKHNRLPILLNNHATMSDNTPGLAVVGFHEGAFWGSMEMESRLMEQKWSSESTQNGSLNGNHTSQTTIESLKELRVAMNNKEHDVPQYWLGDYVGLMESIARLTHTSRNDRDNDPRSGPIAVSRYTTSTDDQSEALKTLDELQTVSEGSLKHGLFVSRATFLSLQGHWTIHRTITSHLPTMPSGILTGTASFHPRKPTAPSFDFEFLYLETGTFTTSTNLTMQASRQYVYRYLESTDQISVWFVKPDARTVDYLYHDIEFEDAESRGPEFWRAKAAHLCVKDMYESKYAFRFDGAYVKDFSVTHEVKGPKKDYVSVTEYKRTK